MIEAVSSLPSVVIVGRPNVGKSTLFNAIIGQRRSIVGDEPGITRDRIYGEAAYRGRKFDLIDTGGIILNDEEMIPTQILKQARMAFEEASHVIFLIDGRSEITGVDRDLARMLHKLGKPVSVAVNKIDSPKREALTHEFHSLGFKHLFPVSAEHRLGFEDLLDHVTEGFTAEPVTRKKVRGQDAGPEPEPEEERTLPIKIAIIGRPNVGKSTLLNALTGTERAIVSPVAGTTRDAVDEKITDDGTEYVFVDTAGIRRKGKTKLMAEKLSVVMARRHLRMSHVALLVMDATEGVLALDATIAGYAHEEGRAIILVVNKWDASKDKNKSKFIEQIRDNLKFLEYAPIAFVSAEKRIGTRALLPLIKKAYEAASRRITTGELNRFVASLDWEYDMKIYYMTQANVRPPTFVAFTDKAGKLHFSAERYLANRLRERFDFTATPIVIRTKRR
jgi:GTP-binding protein